MLTIPEGSSPYASIIAIDPGTETLGIAALEFDCRTLEIRGSEARTFKGSKMIRADWMEEIHGARFARIRAHCENFGRILRLFGPAFVASESPFFSRAHPQAYGALTEIVYALKLTLYEHDPTMDVTYIDPPTVKNAVGAKGNADKDAVKAKVLGLPELKYAGEIPLVKLDEHSIDALAVAYAKYRAIRAMWFNGQGLEPL
jgi:Holliday junction resolvasome RuvABC endonuclease subunit